MLKRFTVIFVVLLFLITQEQFALAKKADNLTGWSISYEQGNEALRDGRFIDADRWFNNAEKELNQDASVAGQRDKETFGTRMEIILAICLVKFDLHEFKDCEYQLKRFMDLNPYGNAIPYELLGDLYQVEGKLVESKTNYEKAVVARRESRANMKYLAQFYVGMQDRLQKKLSDLGSNSPISLPVPYSNASAEDYFDDFRRDIASAEYMRSHPWTEAR